MPETPRDLAELYLAPLALQVDQRLEEIESVTYLLDLHGWRAAWDDRGIRRSHGGHSLVLRVPSNVTAYGKELPA